MQFQHPELLYALFLLVIPIIVHLFQLRKFQKEEFTNVKFLQRIILQTRKSSQLKKWLTLLTRLLTLACIIVAFAQPFATNSEIADKPQETVIYLDNSFSMQAKGPKGELLKRAIQELLESLPEDEEFTLITNNERFKNITTKNSRNELQELTYTTQDISLKTALLRATNEFSKQNTTVKNFVAISDFQLKGDRLTLSDTTVTINLIQLTPVNTDNLSVDSVYVSERGVNNLTITAQISASGSLFGTLPVSLYDGDNLLAKTSVALLKDSAAETTFTIQNSENINGRIVVEDNGLQYDNSLYFSINTPSAIKVVAISDADDAFLKKLYQSPEFELTTMTSSQLDYNQLNNANCIILNEVMQIPNGLGTILKELSDAQGKVVIIPSQAANLSSYNNLFSQLGLSNYRSLVAQQKQITQISFAHPLYDGVFDKRVRNFQYPKVQSFYPTAAFGNTVLAYEDDSAFLSEIGNVYRFTAAISTENSNFKNAPLIVPTFYNIAKQSLQTGQLYFTNGSTNIIDVDANLKQDDILKIENAKESFIPLQQNYNTKVTITTSELPQLASNYTINSTTEVLKNISFNYSRSESNLTYQNISQLENVTANNQVASFFQQLQENSSLTELWKWFVIFAIVFLIAEMLLLKFLR